MSTPAMTLLLLLSAMLSALTGVGGTARAVETPAVAARVAQAATAQAAVAVLRPLRMAANDERALLAMPGTDFALVAGMPAFFGRRRE